MAGTRTRTRAPRESFAEKRERRAAVDDPAVVLEAAARFLEARSRSVHEVRRRLGGAGYQTELVEGAISRMTELGMLDDEAFARTWVESRDRARPRGERAIREELRLKGIDRDDDRVVLGERRDRAVAAVDGDGSELPTSADRTAAERLLAKNARALARVAGPAQATPTRVRAAGPARIRPGDLPGRGCDPGRRSGRHLGLRPATLNVARRQRSSLTSDTTPDHRLRHRNAPLRPMEAQPSGRRCGPRSGGSDRPRPSILDRGQMPRPAYAGCHHQ